MIEVCNEFALQTKKSLQEQNLATSLTLTACPKQSMTDTLNVYSVSSYNWSWEISLSLISYMFYCLYFFRKHFLYKHLKTLFLSEFLVLYLLLTSLTM